MKVAIIGCGAMGSLHAEMATRCGAKVAVCADSDVKAARRLARQYKAKAVENCRAAAAHPDADIVVVATPTHLHSKYVIAAAKAGKHIFCEKPFGRTLEQCKEALAAARKARVKLLVCHVNRYFPQVEALNSQIVAGKVGKPGFVKMYRGGAIPRGVNAWRDKYAQSGGATLDLSIHDFDWLRDMFGEVERVFCQNLQRSKPTPLDYSLTTLRMKSGVIAHVIGTWASPEGFRVNVEVCGDNGMIQFDSDEVPIESWKRERDGTNPDTIAPTNVVSVSPYRQQWQAFIQWIEWGIEPRGTAEDALEAVRISLAALKSAETGKAVTLRNRSQAHKFNTMSITELKEFAQAGNADAQYELGYRLRDPDSEGGREAMLWWRRAAEQNHRGALSSIAFCLFQGRGVRRQPAKALQYYKKAAAHRDLAVDPPRIRASLFTLIGLFYSETDGVRNDAREALRWFRKAAELGDSESQFRVALAYRSGDGVRKNQKESVKWLRKAARKEEGKAQFHLGLCYRDGTGVPKRKSSAIAWFEKAAANGVKEAKKELKKLRQE